MAKLARRGLIVFAGALLAGAPSRAQGRSEAEGGEALFIISFSTGPGWREGVPMSRQPGMRAHGEYMARLFAERRLYAGGPFMRDDGAEMGEGGLMIVRASSRAEVEQILAADPAIIGGLFIAQVSRWRPRFRADAPLPPWE